jgi:hypothetical protein
MILPATRRDSNEAREDARKKNEGHMSNVIDMDVAANWTLVYREYWTNGVNRTEVQPIAGTDCPEAKWPEIQTP